MTDRYEPFFEQEIRFALVMYGGVSLAVYINGVTQEFLRLVKSTAVDANDTLIFKEVKGTEKVYRKLASLLHSSGQMPDHDSKLRTRFIVDIASGSSAGGINAVFLGKALANNLSLDQLRSLWIEQAGFEDLLNDTNGSDGTAFAQDPPRSLLSSPSIYKKLLEAFVGMDTSDRVQPLQPEMDVFATATDLQGLELPIELSDKQVLEKKYKEVFHLRFQTHDDGSIAVNHFAPEMNSFLAFVTRATSSFPVAFEPMRLVDIDEIVEKHPKASGLLKSDSEKLKPFFEDYTSSTADGSYRFRSFGDGGDLDNKPFSYAIDELSRRTTQLPVHRKLVYIEPSPDAAAGNQVEGPPNFIDNTLKATVTLHQNETIREDLQRILDRNRLIERAVEVTRKAGADVEKWKQSRKAQSNEFESYANGENYKKRTITDEIHDRGPGYAGYYRLKVRSVTDELATVVTRAAELLETSDEFRAIRYIIGYWRDNTYSEDGAPGRKNLSEFLLAFDLQYRLRRVRFLLTKLDEMYASHKEQRKDIRALKSNLNQVASDLMILQDEDKLRGPANFLYAVVKPLMDLKGRAWVRRLLDLDPDSRTKEIESTLQPGQIESIARVVAEKYKGVMIKAADDVTKYLDDTDPALTPGVRALRAQLKKYFEDYEYHDQVTFPIFYATDVGEAEPIAVIRISPEDATSVIDEQNDTKKRKKLAGTTLFHFGAFFDRLWRSNDVLWGRLDGAERIITSLLPRGSAQAKGLIREAHLAIVQETLRPQEQAELTSILVKMILSMPRDTRDGKLKLREILEQHIRKPVDSKVEAVFTACMEDEQFYSYLQNSYEVNREFEPNRALNVLSRSTQILGRMFEDVANHAPSDRVRKALAPPSTWIARFGSIFWGVVQLSVPGGLGNKLVRYWLQILYALEILLLVGSTLILSPSTQQFAVTALLLTAGVHIITSVLRDFMRTPHWLFRVPLMLVMLALLSLAAIGGWTVKEKVIELLKGPAATSTATRVSLP